MNWRGWLYGKLTTEGSLIAVVPAPRVFAGGVLDAAPANTPFVIYRLQDRSVVMNDGDTASVIRVDAQVWVYDHPGSYTRIDAYLETLRALLSGAVAEPSAIVCAWQGDSAELFDDSFKCGARYASFRLTGKA